MVDVVTPELPALGGGTAVMVLKKWLKKPGDRVERGGPLLKVSTEEVNAVVPSPAAGLLSEILMQEGESTGPGVVIARISEMSA